MQYGTTFMEKCIHIKKRDTERGINWMSPYQNVNCGLSLGERITDGIIWSFEISLHFNFSAIKMYYF